MKYGIFVLVFAAFVAGYFVGQARPFTDADTSSSSPLTTSTSSLLTPTLNAQSVADSDLKSGAPNNQTTDPLTSNNQTSDNPSDDYQQQSILPDNSDETESGDVLASQNDDIQKGAPSSDANTSDQQNAASFPAAQEELDEWVTARKEALQQQLNDAIGEQDALWMYDQVLKDNEFLNQPAATNAFDDDVVSRFEMEQKLRDFITARSKDPQLQILSVNCIQGRCEITLEGKDQTAAIFLFFDIQKDNSLGVIELMTPTFYMNDEGNYWLYRTLTYAVN
ncbi:hypothetical protein [Alteromonas sp. BMJM2]|uniref:hypothetical protein n=1 Tax=Alteromonas sp. BMJM2 TaxID=2954241 RepID=UPI0022B375E7|nr:hypothetical protein [Alteromonas sp. BMJM2]